jgi:hypothetical protein
MNRSLDINAGTGGERFSAGVGALRLKIGFGGDHGKLGAGSWEIGVREIVKATRGMHGVA